MTFAHEVLDLCFVPFQKVTSATWRLRNTFMYVFLKFLMQHESC